MSSEDKRLLEVIDREWKMARVLNLMQLARKTGDWEWFKEIAAEYRKLIKQY